MNKRIAIPLITVLAVGVSAGGYFVVQQSNKLRESESEIVALEDNVSTLEENVSTLEGNGSILEVKLTDLEAKVSTLEADLEEANDDVELQQKLVGQTTCVEWEHDGILWSMPGGVTITNPDCVSEITIEGISVFAYDGTVVYEGPLRVKVDHEWEVYTGPVRPHQLLQSSLEYYDLPELTREVEMQYTVEIFWTWTDKKGLPLTGWVPIFTIKRDASTGDLIDLEFGGVVQMVNMEQELESEDKD